VRFITGPGLRFTLLDDQRLARYQQHAEQRALAGKIVAELVSTYAHAEQAHTAFTRRITSSGSKY